MKRLEIKRSGAQLLVGIPFAAKDNFKKCFPDARWIKSEKAWSVSALEEKRLRNFVSGLQLNLLHDAGVFYTKQNLTKQNQK